MALIWLQDSRADSMFAPSQWETSLQSNDVSHWLGANIESALRFCWQCQAHSDAESTHAVILKHSSHELTGLHHHDSCWCPGAKWAPGHQQPPCLAMTIVSHKSHYAHSYCVTAINSWNAGTKLIRFNIVNMVADTLAPCVTRTSAAMILIM